jgi:WD40 repeat protein
VIAGAFEDAMIRLFDKSRMVHSFEAHEQAVMSLSFTSNPYELFSCGQDGAVKLWDLRKYAEVCSFKVNMTIIRHIKASTTRLAIV